jgi:hypothetical protein
MLGTISAAGVSSVYVKFAEDRLLNGGTLLVDGGQWGDSVSLKITDRDNIYGLGAGAVLRVFGENYYINPNDSFQVKYEVPYVAKLPAGLYIQIDYDAVAAGTRTIVLNLTTHIPTVEV